MSLHHLKAQDYNPDILNTLANLSSDEVFTPPEVANQVLDLLPQELFSNPDATFLDPATKSGVFLREIAKRLMVGLVKALPDEQERRDHIFHKQLYGIAITELTSLMSRRSLYCSKFPNGRYSVSLFDNAEGNIRFKHIEHQFVQSRCVYCGASESQFGKEIREGLEHHAYEFIHTHKPEEIFGMKFDVIIGNPPYQLSTGGSGVQATPIYNHFILNAKKLKPRYLSMIIPARWYAGGFGLDAFRSEMLSDRSIRLLHDIPEAGDVFSGVQIKGGICYFLWDRDHKGECTVRTQRGNDVGYEETRPLLEEGSDVFIRYNEAVDILRKVKALRENTIEVIVSAQKPFGLATNFKGHKTQKNGDIIVYGNKGVEYIQRIDVLKFGEMIDEYKVFIPAAGSGSDSFPHQILGKPFFGDKGTICTETFVVIGPIKSRIECENVISYIRSRLFRFLVMLRKPTQHALRKVYSFVPIQDFSKPWTDAELYAKYGLSEEEIAFIESMIRPMDAEGNKADA